MDCYFGYFTSCNFKLSLIHWPLPSQSISVPLAAYSQTPLQLIQSHTGTQSGNNGASYYTVSKGRHVNANYAPETFLSFL